MDHESYSSWNPFIKQISGTTQPYRYLSVISYMCNLAKVGFDFLYHVFYCFQ